MPIAAFADPTAALEPPPQPSESDTWWKHYEMVQAMALDPFGTRFYTPSAPPAREEVSWGDVFKDVAASALRDLSGAITGRVGSNNPSAIALQTEAARKAEQQKLFLIVGGVGVAVVIGAIVLSRRGKR